MSRVRFLLMSTMMLCVASMPSWAGEGSLRDENRGPEAVPDGGVGSGAESDTRDERDDRNGDRVKTSDRTPPAKAGSTQAAGPCAAEMARLQRRVGWLQERMLDQAKRGFPSPQTGVPNTTGLYCGAHPTDEECSMGAPPAEFSPDELSYDAQKTPEDRDPHVIGLKRALDECRRRNGIR